jgi:hypothetical protein
MLTADLIEWVREHVPVAISYQETCYVMTDRRRVMSFREHSGAYTPRYRESLPEIFFPIDIWGRDHYDEITYLRS